ncbi:MAG: caspase family protein [Magnetococcales bacterium]|nr:caspase family protein [Magnetococcales bacterium]
MPAHAIDPQTDVLGEIWKWAEKSINKQKEPNQRRRVENHRNVNRHAVERHNVNRRQLDRRTVNRHTTERRTVNRQLTSWKRDPRTAAIQKHLAALGFNVGKVDGMMGRRTAQAIRSYQKMVGMPVDGRISDGLLARLNGTQQQAKTYQAQARPAAQPPQKAVAPPAAPQRPSATPVAVATLSAIPPAMVTMEAADEPEVTSQAMASSLPANEPVVMSSAREEVPSLQPNAIDFGRYHALVIGIDRYKHLPDLKSAGKDAGAIAKVLEQRYGYRVNRLLNPNRKEILLALNNYRKRLKDNDNLLIYYAGHGRMDKESDSGYWLPMEASEEDDFTWVSLKRITSTLRAMEAKHVMVISDSCYSGKLTRGLKIRHVKPGYHARIAKTRTRVVMTSGTLEPVLDSNGNGHSVFAGALLTTLKKNDSQVTDGISLFRALRKRVMLTSNQKPVYANIRKAGHDGGDFLFVKKH